ncbi:hypothetical protein CEV33_2394 [Brucella grignonensis]|uniref:Uncharacterized protein n=1 Tax=Brucella grignonensis TaxID=94627 RepID=A0A256F7Y8_9HYPH|nr:hypothetical protein CEV33_2394 [Brucella grignonensis]
MLYALSDAKPLRTFAENALKKVELYQRLCNSRDNSFVSGT